MAAATTMTTQTSGYARWTPTLPTSLTGIFSPFLPTGDNANTGKHGANNDDNHSAQQARLPTGKRPIVSTITVKDGQAGPPSPAKSTGSNMFAEPETRSNSDDGSRTGSIDELRRSKKSSRPKTQFSICHPPPESKVKQKLHRRPRSLLQLHRLSHNARPQPAFEVIPSANFSVRLTRAITRVFKAKHGLCPNDLVIMSAEKYTHEEEDEDQEARDVIGLICKGRKDEEKNTMSKVTIHMASGKTWEASCLTNGAYEFCTVDEHGLGRTVRWVPRKDKSGKANAQRKFNFSTISPSSRRHPVIAYLKKSGLDINDKYKIPEPSTNTPMGSPTKSTTALDEAMDEESGGQELCETDEELREIITMTGIWVTFKEGWSPSFRYDDPVNSITSPPGSPAPAPLEKRSSMKSIGSGIMRRTSVLSKSNRSSTASIAEEEEPQAPSRSASISTRTGRARADSSSTVLIHRATSNRRKNNNSQATWRPDLLAAAHDPLPEASREDLSRDFSAQNPQTPDKASPLADGRSDGEHAKPLSEDETGHTGTVAPSPLPRSSLEKPEHRESTATTETSGYSPPPNRNAQKHSQHKRKKSVWRRLICGQSDSS